MAFALAFLFFGILLGSALTIQVFLIPLLMGRVQDRSTVTRITNDALRRHHTLSVVLLACAGALFMVASKPIAASGAFVLLALNLYQRFWIFTKLHLIKQPIGVQDLIQPDNVLREEFNRLQHRVYLLFRIHVLLLLIDLLIAAF
jgi:hypothetical protein